MIELFEKELTVAPGYADRNGRLGYHDTFRAFMDMAAIHAEMIGVGFEDMAAKQLFWLTVKTRVNFIERPRMLETVTLRTWPEAPGRIRGVRSYEAVRNGKTLITGKTEWAVMNTTTHKLAPLSGVYPEELTFPYPCACPEPFTHMADDFAESEIYGEYKVCSNDIDVGRHMNNAAYVRALMGSFSNAELDGLDIAAIEVLFRAPCFEGDTLTFYRRREEKAISIRMANGDQTAILARIMLR